MYLKNKAFIWATCLLVSMTPALVAIAGDVPGQPVPPPPTTLSTQWTAMIGAGGASYVTSADNEDNAHSGSPDNDMGGSSPPCIFNTDSIHPIEFNINVTGALPTTSAELAIQAWDVDETSGEVDDIYVNGTLVGTITGADNVWSTTIINVPIGLIVAGNNLIEIHADTQNSGSWCVGISSGQLRIDGGATEPASCRTISIDQSHYPFGATVNATLEADTTASSQSVDVEINLLDPNAVNIAGATQTKTITGSANDAFNAALILPTAGSGSPPGTFTAQGIIYDTTSKVIQDTCTVNFQVGDQVLAPSIPVPTLNGRMLAILCTLLALFGLLAMRRKARHH